MAIFEATIQHNDKTLEDLAHMQYDLFCKGNRIGKAIISIACILLGIANSENWWGILVIAYGCYLTTSTYSASNHTAHKLARQIRAAGMQFPASRYEFTEEGMVVYTLPENKAFGEPMPYGAFCKLGEDRGNFYIFRDQYGGYMIPKSELAGEEEYFRDFIQRKSGQRFERKMAPVAKFLQRMKDRESRPYHL